MFYFVTNLTIDLPSTEVTEKDWYITPTQNWTLVYALICVQTEQTG